jgi:hypothetical protein
MSESAHPHPVRTYLDTLNQQRDRLEEALQELLDDKASLIRDPLNQVARGAPPPVQLGEAAMRARGIVESKSFYVGMLSDNFKEESRLLCAAALAAIPTVTSVRAVQDDLAKQLMDLGVRHEKLMEDMAQSASDWVHRNGTRHYDVQVDVGEHWLLVDKALALLTALQEAKLNPMETECTPAALTTPPTAPPVAASAIQTAAVPAETTLRPQPVVLPAAETAGQPIGDPPDQYVTLDQMAARVNRSKKALAKRLNAPNSTMPKPDVEGGGGKPHEWIWANIRPWLETEFGKKLPEIWPRRRADGN